MPSENKADAMEPSTAGKSPKLGTVSGVYIPVVLNILSILMFLRFGSILGRIGLIGMLGLLAVAYFVDIVTTLSLSAIASNGEVKGGGAYFLISRSLGPEFGGSIGVLFYMSQVLNTALNVVGLIDCLRLNLGHLIPQGFWHGYLMETCALVFCTVLCLAGSAMFAKASNGLLVIILVATLSIPFTALVKSPFQNPTFGIEFTGLSSRTLASNLYPATGSPRYHGSDTFRELFGVLFPATSGIFAGASMSGDLRNPSKAIPKGTLWAMLTTSILYVLVILSLASSITHESFLRHTNIISVTSIWSPLILAGECAVTFFSALMGLIGSAKLLQALARDKLLPGIALFGQGSQNGDDPVYAVFITYIIAQVALFANLNQIATLISMGYQMTFFVMNLACFLLKIGSAPNFRPAFKFFSWQSALVGSICSAAAMFFIDATYATSAVCLLFLLFLLIHYMSPPKHWGDVSQNLIYHQVRKYLLRLKPEHIKFWRPHIILLINDPRHHTRLIQFCNSMKKGSLYILGHVIVTDDFNAGIHEAKLQQSAWTRYILDFSRIKAFVQLTMSPSIEWGVRNLILSAGLGGMRPNIAVLGFYNMDELRRSKPLAHVPDLPGSSKIPFNKQDPVTSMAKRRRRGDISARLLETSLPTDAIRTEGMLSVTSYLTILEDLALRHRLNVAIGKGFQALETPRPDGSNTKKYVDLWPIQMSAEITSQGNRILTTNFDTYTLVLQLGYILHSVPAWRNAYCLRILVFVEYENEIIEEQARLEALLEKLRIDAEVKLFCLASGSLSTYENIINGKTLSREHERVVNELFKDDEWWHELQNLRQRASSVQQMASLGDVLEASRRRSSTSIMHEIIQQPRRMSMQGLLDISKTTTGSDISRLGTNLGIHTNQLGSRLLDESIEAPGDEDSDDEDESDLLLKAQIYDTNIALNQGVTVENDGSASRPLLPNIGRPKSHGDVLQGTDPAGNPERPSIVSARTESRGGGSGYGTMKSTPSIPTNNPSTITPFDPSSSRADSTQALLSPLNESAGPSTTHMPSTTGPPTRPPFSRNSSMGKFSSRPVPETRMHSEDGGVQRLMFAESQERPARSRRNSLSRTDGPSGSQPNIPELLESYRLGVEEDSDAHSDYTTRSLPFSFNDLPSRAQHLILNELMRQNSSETAVLLTTLPIPEEGTCKSEETSLRYLSDIEVLCHELPPVLLVLSNSMTVTVSL